MSTTDIYIQKHLTNLVEWQKIGEANIFPPESRLELINGEILEMTPIGSRHASHLKRINRLFSDFIDDSALIAVQDPVQLGDLSQPKPDFMLLRPSIDFYYENHPTANDVYLLIEIAESSLKYDRNLKLRLYALHKIPEYWLLNVNDSCLEVYRQPENGLYAEKTTLRAGDKITLSRLNQVNIKIADIL